MRRTKASLIYRRTKNLRAVQLLLGHSKLESTVRYLGIEVDDALELAEQTDVGPASALRGYCACRSAGAVRPQADVAKHAGKRPFDAAIDPKRTSAQGPLSRSLNGTPVTGR